MKVLVTGATGRIGNNLARHLREQGYDVRGTALPDDPGLERAKQNGLEIVTGNLRDDDFCRDAIAGCQAVMHLGAMLLFGPDDNPALFEDNLRATFNLLEASSRQGGMERFVLASSDEVYPSLDPKYLPIDETHPKQPRGFYGFTKLASEELVQLYNRAHRIPGAIARFALTIEPWEVLYPQRPLGNFLHVESMLPMIRNRSGAAAADHVAAMQANAEPALLLARDDNGVPYQFQYCDVRDLVQGLQLLLEHPAAVGEAFNLSGPAPFSYDYAAGVMNEATGRQIVDATLPGPPIRIHHSTAKARNMLGYVPRHDLRSTVAEALRTDPGKLPG